MSSFDFDSFVVHLAVYLLQNLPQRDATLYWSSRRLLESMEVSEERCLFVDAIFEGVSVQFGSLWVRPDGSATYSQTAPFTMEDLQAHFGGRIDVDSTPAPVLAKAMANALKELGPKASESTQGEESIPLFYADLQESASLVIRGGTSELWAVSALKVLLRRDSISHLDRTNVLTEEEIASCLAIHRAHDKTKLQQEADATTDDTVSSAPTEMANESQETMPTDTDKAKLEEPQTQQQQAKAKPTVKKRAHG